MPGQSALEELWRGQTKDAQRLLHDIQRVRENLSAARTIDWAQHERVLSKFSPAKSVELACGKNAASLEVRCYARVLELIMGTLRKARTAAGKVRAISALACTNRASVGERP